METTRDRLLEVIKNHPGATRKQLLEVTGLPGSRVDPARMRLWLAGMIAPDSEAGWEAALSRNFRNVGWQIVEDPLARQEVAARASVRTPRNAEKSAEEKASEIWTPLAWVVNEMVQQMLKDGAASPKAQKRAKQALRKKATERRQEARQAERNRTADAEFKASTRTALGCRGAVAAVTNTS